MFFITEHNLFHCFALPKYKLLNALNKQNNYVENEVHLTLKPEIISLVVTDL